LQPLPPSPSVILLPKAEFPLRGTAGKTLLERALALLPEDSEFLILRLEADGSYKEIVNDQLTCNE
jgi:hypothetical protein